MGLINKEDAETLARIIGAREAAKYLHAKSWRVHAMRVGYEVPLTSVENMSRMLSEGIEIFLSGPSGPVSIVLSGRPHPSRLALAMHLVALEEKSNAPP